MRRLDESGSHCRKANPEYSRLGCVAVSATIDTAPPAAAPEPGQLALVRGRMWAVGDVTRDAQASLDGRPVQHLVSLVSVEDDATGEELEVVWEIEPGTKVVERAELPPIAVDRLDDPADGADRRDLTPAGPLLGDALLNLMPFQTPRWPAEPFVIKASAVCEKAQAPPVKTGPVNAR